MTKAILGSEVVRWIQHIIAGLMNVRSGDHSSIVRVIEAPLLHLLLSNTCIALCSLDIR